MRLGKKAWVIIGIVVLAIALGFMVSLYSQTSAEHRQLTDRLDRAQTDLPRLRAEKTDLESQLAQATSSLDRSRAKFPQAIESVEYGEDLCRTAVEHGLRIVDFDTRRPTDRPVGDISYIVASFDIVVSGTVSNILDFLDALRTGTDFQDPWSAQLREVKLDYRESEVTIALDIYGYK